jgi:Tol biopolymer transport system component
VRRCLEKDARRRLRDIGDARLDLDDAVLAPPPVAAAPPAIRRLPWIAAGAVVPIVAAGIWWWLAAPAPSTSREASLRRITDAVGLEEAPALSPDGRTIAFSAPAGGRRQIWLQLLAGGAPLQLTHDDADHRQPRWAPDSNALIYYTAADSPDEPGTIWEIAALGGTPRPLARALAGGDVSPDGTRVVAFQYLDGGVALVVVDRSGGGAETLYRAPPQSVYEYPRWSPDGAWVAFERVASSEFDERIYVLPAGGGIANEIARGDDLNGLAWLPDGSGIIYASSRGSTVLYPPTFNLRIVGRDGTGDRQLTYGDTTYLDPDVHRSGALLASRISSVSNIWRFAVDGAPAENTANAVRITRQTSAVQTPSLSPDGREIVYLSDNGGHGNLWVAPVDGGGTRQITFERDPDVSIGVPVWSPVGDQIAFVMTRAGTAGQALVNRDGTGFRRFVERGVWAFWAPDGNWLYYALLRDGRYCIEKAPLEGGPPVSVRCDNAVAPAVSPDGRALFYTTPLRRGTAGWDWEIRKAEPESGPSRVLGRVTGARIPVDPFNVHLMPSPDGRWLALPLLDGMTSNLWLLSSADGSMRRLTDFGDRVVVMARRVSWSPDGRQIYAAVAELDADVVLLDGLLPQ